MNPPLFLDTANKLLDSAIHEGDLRSAVSRAYYAVYHSIRIEILKNIKLALIQQSGLGSKKLISHERLCLVLKGCITTRVFGFELNILREARQKADYELESVLSRDKAREHVENAQKLQSGISAFGGVTKLVEALRVHLEQIHPSA